MIVVRFRIAWKSCLSNAFEQDSLPTRRKVRFSFKEANGAVENGNSARGTEETKFRRATGSVDTLDGGVILIMEC